VASCGESAHKEKHVREYHLGKPQRLSMLPDNVRTLGEQNQWNLRQQIFAATAPQALSSLQTVIKNWPEFKFAWNAQVWIGVCYEQLKRANRRKPKMDYDALIEEAYATVLEKYPDCTMVFLANLKLAELKYEQGRWEESAMHAERYLADKYIAHSAQRAGVLYKLGQCYEKMGEPDVARTVYQQHLTEFPDDKLPTHSKVLARLAAVNGGEQ
jgi:tetratricopeptide (TPR) repeat protein